MATVVRIPALYCTLFLSIPGRCNSFVSLYHGAIFSILTDSFMPVHSQQHAITSRFVIRAIVHFYGCYPIVLLPCIPTLLLYSVFQVLSVIPFHILSCGPRWRYSFPCSVTTCDLRPCGTGCQSFIYSGLLLPITPV